MIKNFWSLWLKLVRTARDIALPRNQKGYFRSTRIEVTLGKNRWKCDGIDTQNRYQKWCQTITLFKVETVRLGWCLSRGSEDGPNVVVSMHFS